MGFTGDAHYDLPLRPKIDFRDKDGIVSNYLFDAFEEDNPINVVYCDTDNAVGESGTANIRIEDSQRDIDTSLINKGKKIIIQIAKTQSEFTEPWSYFFIGYIRGFLKDRPYTGALHYDIRAYGSKIIYNERLLNMKKSTESQTSKFQLKNLIKSLNEDKASYPFRGPTIKNQANISMDGISSELTQFVSKINFEIIEAASAMDRLADIAGARWFIDVTGGIETLNVAFPISFHSGVVLKSGEFQNKLTDPAESTSYFKGSWNADSDITLGSGYANRLITKTQIDRKSIASNFTNQGSTSLANKALAVKAQIFEIRLTDIALNLSKVGDPQSPNDRVNGAIKGDDNNTPTGPTICTFHIPLGDIKSSAENIFVNDLDPRIRFLDPGMFVWIILYQRSGIKGDPNTDEVNTIRWHHDGNFTNTTTNVSMTALPERGCVTLPNCNNTIQVEKPISQCTLPSPLSHPSLTSCQKCGYSTEPFYMKIHMCQDQIVNRNLSYSRMILVSHLQRS